MKLQLIEPLGKAPNFYFTGLYDVLSSISYAALKYINFQCTEAATQKTSFGFYFPMDIYGPGQPIIPYLNFFFLNKENAFQIWNYQVANLMY